MNRIKQAAVHSLMAGDLPEPNTRHSEADFAFFHRIQRAKASAIGQVNAVE
jgi:hypothetical protein